MHTNPIKMQKMLYSALLYSELTLLHSHGPGRDKAVFLSIGLAGDYRWGEHSVLIKAHKLSQGSTIHWQWQA